MNGETFRFKRKDEDSLLLVYSKIAGEPSTLALDTGATHTVVDLTLLLMAGYNIDDALRTVAMETAKGTIEVYVFNISELTCLGLRRKNMEVCSYDLLANNVLTSIDGVLGLDFFDGCVLNIDFVDCEIFVKHKRF